MFSSVFFLWFFLLHLMEILFSCICWWNVLATHATHLFTYSEQKVKSTNQLQRRECRMLNECAVPSIHYRQTNSELKEQTSKRERERKKLVSMHNCRHIFFKLLFRRDCVEILIWRCCMLMTLDTSSFNYI